MVVTLEGVTVFSFPFFPEAGVFGVFEDFCRGMVGGWLYKLHMDILG